MQPYYQYCNRLAALYALNRADTPARLLYVYSCGDANEGRTCPKSEVKWKEALAARDAHVGLPQSNELNGRIHTIFVDVRCVD